jgi:hypothetical protein
MGITVFHPGIITKSVITPATRHVKNSDTTCNSSTGFTAPSSLVHVGAHLFLGTTQTSRINTQAILEIIVFKVVAKKKQHRAQPIELYTRQSGMSKYC